MCYDQNRCQSCQEHLPAQTRVLRCDCFPTQPGKDLLSSHPEAHQASPGAHRLFSLLRSIQSVSSWGHREQGEKLYFGKQSMGNYQAAKFSLEKQISVTQFSNPVQADSEGVMRGKSNSNNHKKEKKERKRNGEQRGCEREFFFVVCLRGFIVTEFFLIFKWKQS